MKVMAYRRVKIMAENVMVFSPMAPEPHTVHTEREYTLIPYRANDSDGIFLAVALFKHSIRSTNPSKVMHCAVANNNSASHIKPTLLNQRTQPK